MNRDAAEAAAAWWVTQVRATRPETDGLHPDQGRDEAFRQLASIGLRGTLLDSAPPVTDVISRAFQSALANLIAESAQSPVRLLVDYGPAGPLRDAAVAAGLHTAHFPQKTGMTVHPDHVIAKAGYRAPWRLIWSAPDWQHPPCGVQDWPEGSDDPIGPECARPRWHEGGHDWELS